MASFTEKNAIDIVAHNSNESSSSIEFESKQATTTALETPQLDNARLHYVKRG
jgi:hypothetical protein